MTPTIADSFNHIYSVIRSGGFLRKEALGGEIGFFIHAYRPGDHDAVEKAIRLLINRLAQDGIVVLEINLFDTCLAILQQQNRLEQIIGRETEMPKDRFLKALQSSLSVEQRIIPAIESQLQAAPPQVVFLTGVGQVFPFIRSHTILNNLQRIITGPPLVIFFPGQYNGVSLELFGVLHDDNYYRAFNLENLRT